MTGSDVFICYKKSMNRADLISYKPTVLSRYPLRNNPLYALEETVALFCLPMGANLECWPATSARASSVTSSFVLTLANREEYDGRLGFNFDLCSTVVQQYFLPGNRSTLLH